MNTYNTNTIYSKTQNNKIRFWRGTVIEKYGTATLTIIYGYVNGKETPSISHFKQGKNIGKRNQTTPFEQAVNELKSKYAHKLKEGYKYIDLADKYNGLDLERLLIDHLPVNKVDDNNRLKPMKAQMFKPNKLKYPVFGQYKINGVRAFARLEKATQRNLFTQNRDNEVILRSKEGLRYNIKHIENRLLTLFKESKFDEDIILDGEIYIPNINVTTIGGAARNINNPHHKELIFVIFDIAIPDVKQQDRTNILSKLLTQNPDISECPNDDNNEVISILNSYNIHNDDEAEKFAHNCIQKGYEGAIFRDKYAEYRFGSRPVTMRKLKFKKDSEFLLVDIVPAPKANYNGKPLGLFLCKNNLTNDTFTVTPQDLTHAERAYILEHKHKYIGKLVTVFYYERTVNKLPFHANGIIRDYE